MNGTENETIARSMVAARVTTKPGVAGRRQPIGVDSSWKGGSYYLENTALARRSQTLTLTSTAESRRYAIGSRQHRPTPIKVLQASIHEELLRTHVRYLKQ